MELFISGATIGFCLFLMLREIWEDVPGFRCWVVVALCIGIAHVIDWAIVRERKLQ